MIIHRDYTSLYPHMVRNGFDGPSWTSWEAKFIFLKRINYTWVFCRKIHRRRHLYATLYDKPFYDYALNDLELIQKSEVR